VLFFVVMFTCIFVLTTQCIIMILAIFNLNVRETEALEDETSEDDVGLLE